MDEKQRLMNLVEAGQASQDEYLEAKRLYEAALEATPDDAEGIVEYAYLLRCEGTRLTRIAAKQYERAIELRPEWPTPRFQLTRARAALGEIERVIEWYKQRLDAHPDDVTEYQTLISAYMVAGEPHHAELTARAALELWPDNAQLMGALGDSLAHSSPEEAEALFLRAREIHEVAGTGDLSTTYSLAFLYDRLGRLQDAIDQWQRIITSLEGTDLEMHTEWPRNEIRGLEARLREQNQSA